MKGRESMGDSGNRLLRDLLQGVADGRREPRQVRSADRTDAGFVAMERWTPSFGQVFVTAKVESGVMIQATLG